jgi:hypothetical protein
MNAPCARNSLELRDLFKVTVEAKNLLLHLHCHGKSAQQNVLSFTGAK